ncbi:hypothetical protein MPTK1_7g12280 [Marchantia polymorpha subsp. ruderalis]|uniref:Uncharacterized protein n=2 Tax=Marchantia polymorpha TaxID=3197 RepID=A0AAF6BYQ5_MARPO|nr:hypothetical protein MARPO_0003s0239 [Marchantia polymorpha]BBN17136.1 hypothetical protein Mp_7g12280 [Marchantia polymorpha subsp. ruderalis]PTQ49373.1 hypothetical protein MARPO_0003s0239 [Marchantia polymorpha]PTQ49374.1 hypothetical protein MARPO_0003s0239 [Marchantia polymorpha]PTQ49375.1 hypothetical protein MARPO_0003s0239 [Marchantia polymorpha]|eukprot:PTQ49372.1 hypothetical protein MARPO_0003s0239 [Marchantia polymorpha]
MHLQKNTRRPGSNRRSALKALELCCCCCNHYGRGPSRCYGCASDRTPDKIRCFFSASSFQKWIDRFMQARRKAVRHSCARTVESKKSPTTRTPIVLIPRAQRAPLPPPDPELASSSAKPKYLPPAHEHYSLPLRFRWSPTRISFVRIGRGPKPRSLSPARRSREPHLNARRPAPDEGNLPSTASVERSGRRRVMDGWMDGAVGEWSRPHPMHEANICGPCVSHDAPQVFRDAPSLISPAAERVFDVWSQLHCAASARMWPCRCDDVGRSTDTRSDSIRRHCSPLRLLHILLP